MIVLDSSVMESEISVVELTSGPLELDWLQVSSLPPSSPRLFVSSSPVREPVSSGVKRPGRVNEASGVNDRVTDIDRPVKRVKRVTEWESEFDTSAFESIASLTQSSESFLFQGTKQPREQSHDLSQHVLSLPQLSNQKTSYLKLLKSTQTTREGEIDDLIDHHLKKNKQLVTALNKSKGKEELLKEMLISCNFELETVQTVERDDNVIRWSRKVSDKYHSSKDVFLPCDEYEIDENFTLLRYICDSDFLDSVQLDIDNCKLHYPHDSIILVLENYDQFCSKLKTLENRVFTSQIRSRLENSQVNVQEIGMTKLEFEKSVLDLQLLNKVHVFPTKSLQDTKMWLTLFTSSILSLRYEKSKRIGIDNIGLIKSGNDPKDVLVKSLSHLKFVTPMVTNKINMSNISELAHHYMLEKELNVRDSVNASLKIFFQSEDPNELLS